jgi:hypothetical protein
VNVLVSPVQIDIGPVITAVGFGFTGTVNVNGVPIQVVVLGVTVYVAVCVNPVEFVKVPVIFD